jgi:phosphoribosylaminoimidazolecarboxamide formyltransferase/IMP cyclohydrolase
LSNLNEQLPFAVLNGTPGYINLLDAVNAWALVSELSVALDKSGSGATEKGEEESSTVPVAASFKHCSPAGVAIGSTVLTELERSLYDVAHDVQLSPVAIAYLRARNSDPLCSYGDFAALSHCVDGSAARLMQNVVCDGVIAPDFTEEALNILKTKKKGAFIVLQARAGCESAAMEYRELNGVVFSQKRNDTLFSANEHLKNVVCHGAPGEESLGVEGTEVGAFPIDVVSDLILASITVKYTQSNSVGYALNGQMIGVGAGQQSRVDCIKLAGRKVATWYLRQHPKVMDLQFKETVKKQERINARVRYIEGDFTAAELPKWQSLFTTVPDPLAEAEKQVFLATLDGVSVASDGFFPFRDSIDHASKYGVKYIAQPGGSIADEEVIAACREYDMTMAFTNLRLFHH